LRYSVDLFASCAVWVLPVIKAIDLFTEFCAVPDFTKLCLQLRSTTRATAAMKQGSLREPLAARAYSEVIRLFFHFLFCNYLSYCPPVSRTYSTLVHPAISSLSVNIDLYADDTKFFL